jgi:hypothetical protein
VNLKLFETEKKQASCPVLTASNRTRSKVTAGYGVKPSTSVTSFLPNPPDGDFHLNARHGQMIGTYDIIDYDALIFLVTQSATLSVDMV